MSDHPRRNHMTEAEYDRERAKLREIYGDSSAEAAAKRDQAMALLFERSGWTQERLAQKEGKSQSWITKRLLFGRFLDFSTMVLNAESAPKELAGLTERKFRSYWEQTDKSETKEALRFRAVRDLMSEDNGQKRRPQVRRTIIDQFGDGKWHRPAEIAAALDWPENKIDRTLIRMKSDHNRVVACEEKRLGKTGEYRIFKSERTISAKEIKTKLLPILKGLKIEGKKNMATMSPSAIARYAVLLERQLAEWTEGTVSSVHGRPDELAAIHQGVEGHDDV